MTDKNTPLQDNAPEKTRFTTEERHQIREMIKYLIIVLLFVIAASLVMAVVVPAVTAQ